MAHPRRLVSTAVCVCVLALPAGGFAAQEVSLLPSAFDPAASTWDEYGAFFEGNPEIARFGATHTHAFGRAVGRLVYRFEAPWTAGQLAQRTLEVSARLSSEVPFYSASPDETSEVFLLVNNARVGSRVVIADNGSGRIYFWTFPGRLLQGRAANTIAFAVLPESRSRNGIAIYERAVAPGHRDAVIRLRLAGDARLRAGFTMTVGEAGFEVSAHEDETLRLTAGAEDATIPVQLSGGRSTAPQGVGLSYAWRIDGVEPPGGIARELVFSFSPGRHRVELEVTSEDGFTDSAVGEVEIGVRAGDQTVMLSWPFTDLDEGSDAWHTVSGSTNHNGDDEYAQDWNWNAGVRDRGRVLVSPGAGRVLFAGRGVVTGFGDQVIVLFTDPELHDFAVRFAHMEEIWVGTGDTVCAGTPLGRLGASGTPDNAYHLHAAVYMGVFQTAAVLNGVPITGFERLLEGGRPVRLSGAPTAFAVEFDFTRALRAGCAGGERVVEGRVVSASGVGLGHVRVELVNEKERPLGHDLTLTSSGSFVLRDVRPGTFIVEPQSPNCTFDPPNLVGFQDGLHHWVDTFRRTCR